MYGCNTHACAKKGCQATIHLHHDVEERLRRTHETFYCPAGHHNYFPGKTDEEKRIERLERQIDRRDELLDEAWEERDAWKVQAKTCPFECGFRVLRKHKPENVTLALAFHLVEEHGAKMPETAEDYSKAASR